MLDFRPNIKAIEHTQSKKYSEKYDEVPYRWLKIFMQYIQDKLFLDFVFKKRKNF